MVDNPLQMNDWGIKRFLGTVIVLNLVTLGLLGSSYLGFDIPVVRQAVAFIYLTFIPGFVILRILKLHRLGAAQTFLYSVGSSLAFNIFVALFVSLVYPHVGIDRPISTWPLMGTISVAVAILSFVAYWRDRGFSAQTRFNWRHLLSSPALLLMMLPLLGVLGAQIVSLYQNNVLLLVLIAVLALVPILVVFTRFVPRRYYPLAVISIALALLYHQTLISNYLTGWDVHTEYYFANLVETNGVWDASIPHPYNAMLSIVMLAPTYSTICGMELAWVFKIVYPFVFSLVPLGIYQLCSRQIGGKAAFLAAFFFMSVYTFYTEMVSVARQEIAQLFLVLIVITIVRRPMDSLARSVLCLIFATAIVVSHYALSYFLVCLLLILLLYLLLTRKPWARDPSRRAGTGEPLGQEQSRIIGPDRRTGNGIVTPSFVVFYIVACLSWYMWISGSSTLIIGVELIERVVSRFLTESWSLTASEALAVIMTQTDSLFHEIAKYLHLVTMLLIAAGVLDLLLRWRKKRFNEQYAVLALVAFLLLVIAIPLPYLAGALNTTRLYHLSLVFLAPFLVTGTMSISRLVFRKSKAATALPFAAVSIILAVLLLFNSGFAHELARDHRFWGSLIQQSATEYGDAEAKARFYDADMPEEEVHSARWLSERVVDVGRIRVYATYLDSVRVHALESYGMIPAWQVDPLTDSTQMVESGAYVYLKYANVVDGIGTVLMPLKKIETFDMREIDLLLGKTNKIYASPGSEILLAP